jgi:glycopeptide antibiotics resistance protein
MKKIARFILWVLFIIYCFTVAYIVFFSRGFRTQYTYSHYWQYFTNFVPFKTILNYVKLYNNGLRVLSILQLLGNFVLFLPMGIFLPCIFKGLDRFWKVIFSVFIMVFCVEVIQFFMRVGIIDVDDLIFNLCGAMIGYGILKIPFMSKIFHKIYFIE